VTSDIVLGFDKIQPAQSVFQTDVVEVVGLVNADRTVSEMRFTEFGNDMGESAVKLMNSLPLLNLTSTFS
jgi:hypothetical protein